MSVIADLNNLDGGLWERHYWLNVALPRGVWGCRIAGARLLTKLIFTLRSKGTAPFAEHI
jgi:hypothetical protein